MRPIVLLVPVLLGAAPDSRGQHHEIHYEAGVDQQVLATLVPVGGRAPLLLIHRYLEPAKARALASSAIRPALSIRDANDPSQRPLEADGRRPVWVGPLGIAGGNDAFVARFEPGGLRAFRLGGPATSPLRLPWNDGKAPQPAPDYERAYFVRGGLFAVRSEGAGQAVDFWADGQAQPIRVPWNLPSGTVTGIHDMTTTPEHVLVLLTIQADGPGALPELWLASLDSPRVAAAPARLTRLETGPLQGGEFRFIRSAQGPAGVSVVARHGWTAAPELQIYPLGVPTPLWKARLARLESGRDTAVAAVCARSFLVVRREGQGRDTTIVSTLVGPTGRSTPLFTWRPPAGQVIVSLTLLATASQAVLTTNIDQLERTRRADGWYGWLGYRLDRWDTAPWCAADR